MPDIAVAVNGKPILERDCRNTANGLALDRHGKKLQDIPPLEQENLIELARDRLVARELLFEEALARGIVPAASEVDAEIEKIVAAFPSPAAFETFLADSGIAPMEYYRMARQDLAVSMLQQQLQQELPETTDEAVAEFYREHRDSFVGPEQVRVRHILIRIEDNDRQAALDQIGSLRGKLDEQDFAELARLHSQCPSTAYGGDLGFVSREDVDPAFAAAAFTLEPGIVGDVVETPFGLHLLKVEERRAARRLTLEEAKPKIVRMMAEIALEKQTQVLVARLKSRANIDTETGKGPQ